jgi:hypothetical protein
MEFEMVREGRHRQRRRHRRQQQKQKIWQQACVLGKMSSGQGCEGLRPATA